MQKISNLCFRPMSLNEYQGQDKIKRALSFYIKAARMRGECLDHTIIYGNSGLGKTTLANIIANEMDENLITVSAPSIKTPQEMADILMTLTDNSILFIDEIHRLTKKIEEVLYFAMEDFVIETEIGESKERIEMSPFTLIGATTMVGMLSEPLRNRFQITLELMPYKTNNLKDIVKDCVRKIGSKIDDNCAEMIAKRSRGIPRIANGFVRRIYDFALVMNNGIISKEVVNEAFDFLEIDEEGLNAQDRRYLSIIARRFGTKAVGIETICAALNDDRKTIELVVEPYLIQKGYIIKTPRGRVLTEKFFKGVKR